MAIALGAFPEHLQEETKRELRRLEASADGDKNDTTEYVKDGVAHMPCWYLFEPSAEEAARIKKLNNTLTLDIEYEKDNVFFPCPPDRNLKGDVREDLAYCEEIARSCLRDDGPFFSAVSVFIDRRTLKDESVLLIEFANHDDNIDVVARVRVPAQHVSDAGCCVHNSFMYLHQYADMWPELQDDVTLVPSDSESLDEYDDMELREHEHEHRCTPSQDQHASLALEKEAASTQEHGDTPMAKQEYAEVVAQAQELGTQQAGEHAHDRKPSVSVQQHQYDHEMYECERAAVLVHKDQLGATAEQQRDGAAVGDEHLLPAPKDQVDNLTPQPTPRSGRCPFL